MMPFGIDVRDVFAAVLALALLFAAGSVATRLQGHRRRRERASRSERALGRTIVAELPAGDDFVLLSESETHFYYAGRPLEKDRILAARVLVNGSPFASVESRRYEGQAHPQPPAFADRVEGATKDRWDVSVETRSETLLIECGAIREHVSQELARTVFDALRRTIDVQDAAQ